MINIPTKAKNEIRRRINGLKDFDTIRLEEAHGINAKTNIIILNINNNRNFLLDALQVPLKLFNTHLKHPNKTMNRVNCYSYAKHQPFNIRTKSHKGLPNKHTYSQFNQIRKLNNNISVGLICHITNSEAGVLYYLSGQLDKSIGKKMFNNKDWYQLIILRNGLARIYMTNNTK